MTIAIFCRNTFLAFVLFLVGVGCPTWAAPPSVGRTLHVSPSPLEGIPADHQFATIGVAAAVVQPGDTVLLHTGVYRESVTIAAHGTPKRPIVFSAAPAANVTVTGADRLTGWQKGSGADAVYSIAWPYSFVNYSPLHAHPDDEYHRLIGRTEQVFVQGYLLHQVLERDKLSRGSFYVDLDAKRLYVWSAGGEDLNQTPAEASTRDTLWRVTGANVETRGIRFRYAANSAKQGAVQLAGQADILRDCTIERTNGVGASFQATDQIVQRCAFRENGQMGFGAARVDRIHISDCLIEGNNTKDFSRGWEAGGEKIVLTRGAIIDHCRVIGNRGVGLWFDIGNEDCEVRNCLIADNEDAGIFYEISYGLHAHDNVITGNGLADSPGAWGAQAGICLSSSPGCVVERNLLVANREGFDFREQGRTTPRIDAPKDAKEVAVWNHDETIRHNVLAANRDLQTGGWFDVLDEMHWPTALQGEKRPDQGHVQAPATDQAAPYLARETGARPVGLSLDKLHLTFAGNLYDAIDNEKLFQWGVTWRHHVIYDDLSAVRFALRLEQDSKVTPFAFGDYLTHDFRVPAGSTARAMDCYPRGDVPGVQLGVLPVARP